MVAPHGFDCKVIFFLFMGGGGGGQLYSKLSVGNIVYKKYAMLDRKNGRCTFPNDEFEYGFPHSNVEPDLVT